MGQVFTVVRIKKKKDIKEMTEMTKKMTEMTKDRNSRNDVGFPPPCCAPAKSGRGVFYYM